jgi:hypothetical protein
MEMSTVDLLQAESLTPSRLELTGVTATSFSRAGLTRPSAAMVLSNFPPEDDDSEWEYEYDDTETEVGMAGFFLKATYFPAFLSVTAHRHFFSTST